MVPRCCSRWQLEKHPRYVAGFSYEDIMSCLSLYGAICFTGRWWRERYRWWPGGGGSHRRCEGHLWAEEQLKIIFCGIWVHSASFVIPLHTAVKKNTSRAPQRGGKKKKTMTVAKNEKTPCCVPMTAGGRPLNQSRCLEGIPGRQALKAEFHPLYILAFFCANHRSNWFPSSHFTEAFGSLYGAFWDAFG